MSEILIGRNDSTAGELDPQFRGLYGKLDSAVRATASGMGRTLLARVVETSDTRQAGPEIAFEPADDNGRLLLVMDDLHALPHAHLQPERQGAARSSMGTQPRRQFLRGDPGRRLRRPGMTRTPA